VRLTGLAALLAFALTGAAMAQTFPDDAALRQMLQASIEDGRATGLVLGVIEADGSRRIVAYGEPGEGAAPLGPDSIFEIGSVTKVFTATLLADMLLRGEVSAQAPAQDYAPAGMRLPAYDGQAITLVHLAEQNSGLPRLPDNLDLSKVKMANPYAAYTPDMLLAFLSGYALPRRPGETFEYSNLGMGVLGEILAHRAGSDFETAVRARILTPLRMEATAITLGPQMRSALVQGHDAAGLAVANWDLPALAGAGGLRSSMRDMLTFLAANIGEPETALQRAMRLAHTPRFPISSGAQIGLGWITLSTPAGRILYHDGATGGYGAIMAIDPARRMGVVLLGNRTGVPDDIAMHLMDPAIPLRSPPSQAQTPAEAYAPPDQLASYAGVYALEGMPAFKLAVTLENGRLHVQATGQTKFPLFARTPSRFFLKAVEAELTFAAAADNRPAYLILHQAGVDQKAVRE